MLPKSLRPLFPYLKEYRTSYCIGTICVFCNNGVWIFSPWCFAGQSTISVWG